MCSHPGSPCTPVSSQGKCAPSSHPGLPFTLLRLQSGKCDPMRAPTPGLPITDSHHGSLLLAHTRSTYPTTDSSQGSVLGPEQPRTLVRDVCTVLHHDPTTPQTQPGKCEPSSHPRLPSPPYHRLLTPQNSSQGSMEPHTPESPPNRTPVRELEWSPGCLYNNTTELQSWKACSDPEAQFAP